MRINKKIFLGYMIIFAITILSGYLMGRYVFQEIYEFTKKNGLKNHIGKLESEQISTENIKDLEKKLNVDIIAYDSKNEYNIKDKFEHVIINKNNEEYIVILDNLSDDLYEKISFDLQNTISVEGYEVFGGNYIIPVKIISNGKEYIDYEIVRNISKYPELKMINLYNAKLKGISLRNTLKEDFLEIVLKLYMENNEFEKNMQFKMYEDKEKYEVIVDNKDGITLILVYSYKNIAEVFDELKIYFIGLTFLGLILLMILTVFFTRMITKPILKIRKVTDKIANLDFHEKLDIKNKDEVGELAVNINYLAETLGKALNQLENDKKNTKELMGNLSHEFKTPLTIISGYADLLSEENNEKYVEIISEEVDRLTLLIEETTKAMSLDSKIVNLNLEVFDLKELVLHIIEKFSVNISENINLEVNLVDVVVKADKNKLEQVIYNFISNAIRHAKSLVVIELKKFDKKAVFYVKNDGEKLKNEEKEKIWMKFFKASRESGGSMHRTGLGLYISKSILELHKARYGAENTEDGVIFYFSLEKEKNK